MQVFVYPQSYLKMKGNIKHARERHKEKMKMLGKPYVGYCAFTRRLKNHRDLNSAINTPHSLKKVSWWKKILIKLRTLYFRFIYLFKNDKH